jgi:hypothetical protein
VLYKTAEENDLFRKAKLLLILGAVLLAGGAVVVCTGAVIFFLVVPALQPRASGRKRAFVAVTEGHEVVAPKCDHLQSDMVSKYRFRFFITLN